MNEEELLYVLALQRAKGIGDIGAKKLIAHCGSAKKVFFEKKNSLKKIHGIGISALKHLYDKQNIIEAEKELFYLQNNNIKAMYFEEDSYPQKLKHCIDAPILLFSKGNIKLANNPIISIVGTRKITSYGNSFCEKLLAEIKDYNPVIISGFAYGVDICAHKNAIKHQLQTIGVLAHGFNQIYPKSHNKYVEEMLENGGFITDFWHTDEPQREHFLKRNRIIAGISEATIIIESAAKGGSLVTADIANSYSRDVFAVPGRVTDTYSKGCNNLIKRNEAAILTSAEDLIKMLNWSLSSNSTAETQKVVQKQLFIELQDEEQQVYDYLLAHGKELLDIISLNCKFPIHKTTTLLFQLEMKGVVRPLPGKLFEAI